MTDMGQTEPDTHQPGKEEQSQQPPHDWDAMAGEGGEGRGGARTSGVSLALVDCLLLFSFPS